MDFDHDAADSATSRRSIRRRFAIGAVILLGVLVLASVSASKGTDGNNDRFDQFAFRTEDNKTTTLKDFAGSPLVVNYFAAWCPPCRAELPAFERVHQDRSGDVAVIGISRDNTISIWRSLIAETDVTFTTLYEGNTRGSLAFVDATLMPTTVFVNANGEIEHIWTGPITEAELRKQIDEHLLT